MSSNVLEEIKKCFMVKNIPTGISELLKELSQEDTDINHLIELLEKFPVVCIRLVMVANSAWAAPKVEIIDVKRACMQLGLKMVKSISIALLVSQQFNSQNCKGFSERKFWLASLVTADLMLLLQKQDKTVQIDVGSAHLIGLIHNLGLLAIADIVPEKVAQAIVLSDNSDTTFNAALEKILGINYLEVTQIILQNWGLPVILSHAFYPSSNESVYLAQLVKATKARNLLNLEVKPIAIIEENKQFKAVHDAIIKKSKIYDELCGMYCR